MSKQTKNKNKKKMSGDIDQQSSQSNKYFMGIEFKSDTIQGMDYREVAARIFLSPKIPCEKVVGVINSLENERMSIDSFLRRTNAQIQLLREKDEDIKDKMIYRIDDWPMTFGILEAEDWVNIFEKFGFTYDDLYSSNNNSIEISSAEELANYVKQYICGQDDAIDQIAIPFWQHLESKKNGTCSAIKTPVLLIGETGCGKTELYRRFSEICSNECPVVRINSSDITPQSWKGTHICDAFLNALKSGVKMQDLEYAIVVFNEFDKITHYGSKITSDKGADMDKDMQRDIMRLFERDSSLINTDDNPLSQYNGLQLSVNNLLVVFDGAFNGIEEIIQQRCNAKSIGFVNQRIIPTKTSWMKRICEKDLEEWGFFPELTGRIGTICVLNPLTTELMMKIMLSTKDSILQAHIDYCRQHNVQLVFTDDAIRCIAERAYDSGLGFRNVKTLLARCLSSMYFKMKSTADGHEQLVNVDREYVEKVLNR